MKLSSIIYGLCLSTAVFVSYAARSQASSSQNYVMTNTVKQAGVTNEGQVPGLPIDGTGKGQSIAYFDGLGRPSQTVITKGGATQKDIVAGIEYDAFDRESTKYLPYADINNTATPGSYKTGWQTTQASFYNGQLQGVETDASPFNKIVFEASPLNRVTRSFAPGISWAGSMGTGTEHAIQQQYILNTTQDAVLLFNIDVTVGSLPTSTVNYDAGTLYKNVTIDEHQKQVVEYIDKQGKTILKKVQLADMPGVDHTGWLCTYYVYDDLDNLRFVMPPKAVDAYYAGTSLSDLASGLCFRYEYDYRGRMIIKKVPDAGEVYMVYDQRDRPVYTQDANLLLTNQWMTTLYDNLNRPVMTGLTSYNGTRDALQLFVNQNTGTGTPATLTTGLPLPKHIFLGHREVKAFYKAGSTINFLDGFSSEDNAEFTTILGADTQSESTTVSDSPLPPSNNFIALTYTYYDDYSWTSNSYNPGFIGKLTAGNASTENAEALPVTLAAEQAVSTQGMITGSKVRVLLDDNYSSGNFLSSVNYYDAKGRVIQTQSDNYKGGLDIKSQQYDFSGKILSHYISHNNPAAAFGKFGELTRMQYDNADRVLQVTKSIYDNDGADVTTSNIISKNEYNELGQLLHKTLEPSYNNNTGLEKLDYDYNIRGWLLGVNRAYARDENNNNFFGFDLGYDKTNNNLIGNQQYAAAQYNGNIAGTVWKSRGDKEKRKYDFTYDAANRLVTANFNQYTDGGFNHNAGIDFTVSGLQYDQNGNIKWMNQMGWKLGSAPIMVDQLQYTYKSNSNQLQNVKDGNNDPTTTMGDFRSSANNPNTTAKQAATTQAALDAITDYSYDANGNMIKDYNKDMGDQTTPGILYNYLNLPRQIIIKNGTVIKGTINFIYDASGNKLEKVVAEAVPVTNTGATYIGGFVYQNNVLQFFGQEEGRVRKTTGSTGNTQFVFDYFLKDHLSNIRAVITDEQRIDHYPTATLEGSGAGSPVEQEKTYYDINPVNVVDKPGNMPDYSNDNLTNNPNTYGDKNATSQKMYVLNAANNNRTGLSRVLKVMAGDNINILAKSYYQYSGTATNSYFSANDLITSFLSVVAGGGTAASHGATPAILEADPSLITPLTNFTTNNPINSVNNVKAGISYIIFDDHFKYAGCGFNPVNNGASDGVKSHALTNINIPKNGYIYIYCSNESNVNVFFDNLEVVHTRGPLLEETNYYPFGLTMTGISSKALVFGGAENKYKFNNGNELQSKEFSDGSGLELYDAKNRMYDPQTGRFGRIDPMSDFNASSSPYTFAGNNPLLYNDPLGLDTIRVTGSESQNIHIKKGDILSWTIRNTTSYYRYDPGNKDAVGGFVGEGIKDNSLPEFVKIGKKETGETESGEKTEGSAGLLLAGVGIGLSSGEHIMFNEKTWFSVKTFKTYSQSWGGNGATGGKLKVAKEFSSKFKKGVWAFGVFNSIIIAHDESLSRLQKGIEQTSNVITTFAPAPFSVGWTIGWESGRIISKNDWYRENVRPLIQDAIGIKRDEYPKNDMLNDFYKSLQ